MLVCPTCHDKCGCQHEVREDIVSPHYPGICEVCEKESLELVDCQEYFTLEAKRWRFRRHAKIVAKVTVGVLVVGILAYSFYCLFWPISI